MKTPQRKIISAAIALAFAAGSAHAALERMGPVSRAPGIGGYPAWFQDKTGIAVEFCDLKSQAELNGGWCVLIPPGLSYPETFPTSYFDEHFYYIADNGLLDPAPAGGSGSLRARLVIALEAAFAVGPPIDGDQMTFARHRVFIPNLPWAGDYRVITPFGDFNYYDQKAGDRIFETADTGIACVNTFECTLGASLLGPFLLPSPQAGGAELPPMPDLAAAPRGTDPWFDVLAGATTADPGTGKKYLADPTRIGTVTGSPLPPFTAYDVGGGSSQRDHNTFRIEVRQSQADRNGPVIYTIDGESNFTVAGRLMDGAIPGKVTVDRATYKADASGNVTDLDVFATGSPTTQSRIPAQQLPAPTTPVLSFYDDACGGAVTTNPLTGAVTINPGPYTAPAAAEHPMTKNASDYWGQSQPVTADGKAPAFTCVKDSTARNSAGQTAAAYYLSKVTDLVTITDSWYAGSSNATMTVKAVSTDPTAVLTLQEYGLGGAAAGPLVATPGPIMAPPAKVQVTSNKGGATLRAVETVHGPAQLLGTPTAGNGSMTIMEDCSPVAATSCAQGVAYDVLANGTVAVNGTPTSLRTLYDQNPGDFVVTVVRAPALGTYTMSNGDIVYTPKSNANGGDSMDYTVSYLGKVSNVATVTVGILPVNDPPLAGNVTSGAVVAKTNVLNLISTSTDPDGNADVKNAVITAWPAQLGPQPVPTNGVINFTPTGTGNFTINYQAVDSTGTKSANTASALVSVAGSEAMAYTKQIFVAGRNIGGGAATRWTVSGADSVRQGQTITIAYGNGTIRSTGQACNGTAAVPACVIASVAVDSLGNWIYDQVGTQGGSLDPKDTVFWSVGPTNIRSFSSSPVLGGSISTGIQFK